MNTKLQLKGTLSIRLLDGDTGEVKQEQTFENGITNGGFGLVLTGMSTGTMGRVTHMAIGTGTTAFAPTQTTLVAEVARVALSSVTTGADYVRYIGFFPAGTGTGTITEFGTFTASSGGTMANRALAPAAITKTALDTLEVTWTVYLQQ